MRPIGLIGLFGYDQPRANAFKVFLLATTTVAPIAQFGWAGNTWWTERLLLSAGSLLGAHFRASRSRRFSID